MSFIKNNRKQKRVAKRNIVVMYHGDCSDGFAGAWAAWKKFGAKADYVPLFRETVMPVIRGKEVYLIDFMYSKEITEDLMRNNIRVSAIDHHITAREAALMTHNPLFALDASGATLAWRYFHPGKKMPLFLKYVEDRDIWRWKMPYAKEVLSAVEFPYYDFNAMSKLVAQFERAAFRKKCVETGKVIRAYMNHVYESLAELAVPVRFEGHKAMAVNMPHYFASELGNLLVRTKKVPIAIMWYPEDGHVSVSLRSDGRVDVSQIAKKYGGGGHKAAAGLRLEADTPFPWEPTL